MKLLLFTLFHFVQIITNATHTHAPLISDTPSFWCVFKAGMPGKIFKGQNLTVVTSKKAKLKKNVKAKKLNFQPKIAITEEKKL